MTRAFFLFAIAGLIANSPHATSQSAQRATRTVAQIDKAAIEALPQYLFYQDALIATELKLSDEQKAKLKAISQDILTKHAKAIAAIGAERKADEEKKTGDQKDKDKYMEDKLNELFEKHLTKEQRVRLDQIELQSRMVHAFTDDAIIKALNLTPEQVKIANDLIATLPKRPADRLRNQRDEAADQKTKAYEQFLSHLSAKQKEAWNKLIGKRSEAVDLASRSMAPMPPPVGTLLPRIQFWVDPANPIVQPRSVLWSTELEMSRQNSTKLLFEILELREKVYPPRFRSPRPLEGEKPPASRELMVQIQNDVVSLGKQILSPAQNKRIDQIQLQLRGFPAFDDWDFLRELRFTQQQQEALAKSIPEAVGKLPKITGSAILTFGPDGKLTRQPSPSSHYEPIVLYDILAAALAVLEERQKAVCQEKWGSILTREDWDRLFRIEHHYRYPQALNPKGSVVHLIHTNQTKWSPTKSWNVNADRFTLLGKHSEARLAWDESLKLNSKQPDARQKLTMLLAASPDDKVRDGAMALRFATELCEGEGRKIAANLEVLAAAQAEVGRFDEAVKAQEEAMPLLKTTSAGRMEEMQSRLILPARVTPTKDAADRLNLYKQKKPYRLESVPPSRESVTRTGD